MITQVDVCSLNSLLAQQIYPRVFSAEEEEHPVRNIYGCICGIRTCLAETVGSEALSVFMKTKGKSQKHWFV